MSKHTTSPIYSFSLKGAGFNPALPDNTLHFNVDKDITSHPHKARERGAWDEGSLCL